MLSSLLVITLVNDLQSLTKNRTPMIKIA